MKKYKPHIISIITIAVMLIFASCTSYRISGELTIINDTENILGFKVVRQEYTTGDEFSEEFTLQPDQNMTLKTFYGSNTFSNRGLGINSFIIYNENNKIIKEYGDIHYENIPELNFYLEKTKNRVYYYNFDITDDLLEIKNDFYLNFEEYGFEKVSYGIYRDQHGNSYHPDSHYFSLYTPYIDGLLKLQDIERLNIYRGNAISDISFLEKLPMLKDLDIYTDTNIEDIEPLQYLYNLETLRISGIKTIDILPLRNLNKLRLIDFYHIEKIENLEAIFEIKSLEYLYLYTTQEALNLSNIGSLLELKSLIITSPAEIDLAHIGTLSNLEKLHVGSKKITNLSKLNNPKLERLSFSTYWDYTGVFNLDGLDKLTGLKELRISYLDLFDVRPLLKIPNLEFVFFGDNFVDISPLTESNTIKLITLYTYYKNTPKYKDVPIDTLELFEKKGIEIYFDRSGD